MNDDSRLIEQMQSKLNSLQHSQEVLRKELIDLQTQLYKLKTKSAPEKATADNIPPPPVLKTLETPPVFKSILDTEPVVTGNQEHKVPPHRDAPAFKPAVRRDLERFIGENLINKIGILILIIGVGIGARYAIEHDMISPVMRIVFGYLIGIGLMAFAFRLKEKYKPFSAVLLSGSVAICYFITFSAYSFYNLIPQPVAFIIMVLFTIFTVFAAIQYDMQIIAHIGLVGAYAVPFLLSNDSGRIELLFTYIGVINTGILLISFKRNWKQLLYSSFIATWLIYITWFATKYAVDKPILLALSFATLFFVIFYTALLAYKLRKNLSIPTVDISLLLINAFIYYGIGYSILDWQTATREFTGIFTLANAGIHFAFVYYLHRKKDADRNIFYLLAGLVLLFVTITIPVQLNGNWVTMFWSAEAALLFWFGRSRKINYYEYLSLPLALLALISLFEDWTSIYPALYRDTEQFFSFTPFFNAGLLSTVFFLCCTGVIYYTHLKTPAIEGNSNKRILNIFSNLIVPILFLLVLYAGLHIEITGWWNKRITESRIALPPITAGGGEYIAYNYDLADFKSIWLSVYTMIFVTALHFLNLHKIRHPKVSMGLVLLSCYLILALMPSGFSTLSDLRNSYLGHTDESIRHLYSKGIDYLLIRYLLIGSIALLLLFTHKTIQQDENLHKWQKPFKILTHISVLTTLSFELINWLEMAGVQEVNKLGISILWGAYAVYLIMAGIFKANKTLRLGGMILFGITLGKLFLYDIAHLGTIAKTIVFVVIGILMLISSFLYNKHTGKLHNEK